MKFKKKKKKSIPFGAMQSIPRARTFVLQNYFYNVTSARNDLGVSR